MISRLIQFLKKHQNDIILLIGVILISLLSFALGYIIAKQQGKEPIRFEYEQEESKNSYYWSRNYGSLSGMEIMFKGV